MTLKVFTVARPQNNYYSSGWGNGYVCLPLGHKWHGIHYDNIDVDVHGGLTFSGLAKDFKPHIPMPKEFLDKAMDDSDWVIGFDTAHFYSDSSMDERWVMEETERLMKQC